MKLRFFRDSISVDIGHAELNKFGGVDFSGFRLWKVSTYINWNKRDRFSKYIPEQT